MMKLILTIALTTAVFISCSQAFFFNRGCDGSGNRIPSRIRGRGRGHGRGWGFGHPGSGGGDCMDRAEKQKWEDVLNHFTSTNRKFIIETVEQMKKSEREDVYRRFDRLSSAERRYLADAFADCDFKELLKIFMENGDYKHWVESVCRCTSRHSPLRHSSPQMHPHGGDNCMGGTEKQKWSTVLSHFSSFNREWIVERVERLSVSERTKLYERFQGLSSSELRELVEEFADLKETSDRVELFELFRSGEDYKAWIEQRRREGGTTGGINKPYTLEERLRFERAFGSGWDVFVRGWVLDRLGEVTSDQREEFLREWTVSSAEEKANLRWAFRYLNDSDKRNLFRRIYSGDSYLRWLDEKKAEYRKTQPFEHEERRKWEGKMSGWDLFARIYFVDNIARLPGDERDRLWVAFSRLSSSEMTTLAEKVKLANNQEREELFKVLKEGRDFHFWIDGSGAGGLTTFERATIRGWLPGVSTSNVDIILDLFGGWSNENRLEFSREWRSMSRRDQESFMVDFQAGNREDREEMLRAIRDGRTTGRRWRVGGGSGSGGTILTVRQLREVRGWFRGIGNAHLANIVDTYEGWSASQRSDFRGQWFRMTHGNQKSFIADLKTASASEKEDMLNAVRGGAITAGSWKVGGGTGGGDSITPSERLKIRGWFPRLRAVEKDRLVIIFEKFSKHERDEFRRHLNRMSVSNSRDFMTDLQNADDDEKELMLKAISEGKITGGRWKIGGGSSGGGDTITSSERTKIRGWFRGLGTTDKSKLLTMFGTWSRSDRDEFERYWNQMTYRNQRAFVGDLRKSGDGDIRSMLRAVRGGSITAGSWKSGGGGSSGGDRITTSERVKIKGWFRSLRASEKDKMLAIFEQWSRSERDDFERYWTRMTPTNQRIFVVDARNAGDTDSINRMLRAVRGGSIARGSWKVDGGSGGDRITAGERTKIRGWFSQFRTSEKDQLVTHFGKWSKSDRDAFGRHWGRMTVRNRREFTTDFRNAGDEDRIDAMLKAVREGHITAGRWRVGGITSAERTKIRGWFPRLNAAGKDKVVSICTKWSRSNRDEFERNWKRMTSQNKQEFQTDIREGNEAEIEEMLEAVRSGKISRRSWKGRSGGGGITTAERTKIRGWFSRLSSANRNMAIEILVKWSRHDREDFERYWNRMTTQDKRDFQTYFRRGSRHEKESMLEAIRDGKNWNGGGSGGGNGGCNTKMDTRERREFRSLMNGIGTVRREAVSEFLDHWCVADRKELKRRWDGLKTADKQQLRRHVQLLRVDQIETVFKKVKDGEPAPMWHPGTSP